MKLRTYKFTREVHYAEEDLSRGINAAGTIVIQARNLLHEWQKTDELLNIYMNDDFERDVVELVFVLSDRDTAMRLNLSLS